MEMMQHPHYHAKVNWQEQKYYVYTKNIILFRVKPGASCASGKTNKLLAYNILVFITLHIAGDTPDPAEVCLQYYKVH